MLRPCLQVGLLSGLLEQQSAPEHNHPISQDCRCPHRIFCRRDKLLLLVRNDGLHRLFAPYRRGQLHAVEGRLLAWRVFYGVDVRKERGFAAGLNNLTVLDDRFEKVVL